MEMPVRISVRTTISQADGERESFELVTFGRFFRKGAAYYLLYEEVMDVGKIKTSVKFTETEALILRSGAVNMRLAFGINRRMKGHYETPYGTMDTMTKTRKLQHHQTNPSRGSLDLEYDFWLQEDQAGTYHMEISYQKEEETPQ
ncbi:YwiB family protein [Pseudoneobacillus sp. C159]